MRCLWLRLETPAHVWPVGATIGRGVYPERWLYPQPWAFLTDGEPYMPTSGSNIAWASTDMNVSTSMRYPLLSPLVSSEGTRRQRLCPSDASCCFRNFLELYRYLDKGGGTNNEAIVGMRLPGGSHTVWNSPVVQQHLNSPPAGAEGVQRTGHCVVQKTTARYSARSPTSPMPSPLPDGISQCCFNSSAHMWVRTALLPCPMTNKMPG